jgi:hypothetical protein
MAVVRVPVTPRSRLRPLAAETTRHPVPGRLVPTRHTAVRLVPTRPVFR